MDKVFKIKDLWCRWRNVYVDAFKVRRVIETLPSVTTRENILGYDAKLFTSKSTSEMLEVMNLLAAGTGTKPFMSTYSPVVSEESELEKDVAVKKEERTNEFSNLENIASDESVFSNLEELIKSSEVQLRLSDADWNILYETMRLDIIEFGLVVRKLANKCFSKLDRRDLCFLAEDMFKAIRLIQMV